MKVILRWVLRWWFGFQAYNEAVLRTPGPVLLIPNHVSWLDWLFLGVCLDDDWRFVTSSATAQTSALHRWIMVNRRTFPIDTTSPYAVKRMAEYLQQGGRLVLFAEGRISKTGSLMKLFDGTGFLVFKTGAKVVTAYLRGAERVWWVRHQGWRKWFPRVSVHFSSVQEAPKLSSMSTAQARARVTTWLRDRMVAQQFEVETQFGPRTVLGAVVAMARQRPDAQALEDVTRQRLSYRRLTVAVEVLAGAWRRELHAAGGERVGVLLPNVNAMPLAILSLWAAGRVPAVLNFSTGMATMVTCARLAGLKQIITSRVFLERAKLDPRLLCEAGLELVHIEDVRARIAPGARVGALVRAWLRVQPGFAETAEVGAAAVVLFTSGSEGVPKGVELTHGNVLANIRQMLSVIDLEDSDRVFNALPLFHSFGLTVGTMLPLVRGLPVFLYPSPLHYRVIPTAFYDLDCTVLLATNTFLNGYARKAHAYDFRSLRYLFAGAEKLQETTASVWARQFGVRILEGYGATECSPCLTVNTRMYPRFGAAGRFLPGIEWRLEPVEGVSEGGRLLVRGPNVMRGYLNEDADAKFKALGGWYDTGDIVSVDGEGYLHVLGRLKRFAKVSGEMVSLTAVEDALAGAFPHYGLRCQVAVLSRSDEEKGEALVVVSNEPRMRLEEVRAMLKAKGFSNLCVPRELVAVREIPKLGTGKTNHRALEAQMRETRPSPKSGG